jgi:hypothetical protein
MMMSSLPKPALNTSIPPLPVRISLPAPATEVAGGRSGHADSKASDINGDGLDDFIVGGYGANPKGINSGKAYFLCVDVRL